MNYISKQAERIDSILAERDEKVEKLEERVDGILAKIEKLDKQMDDASIRDDLSGFKAAKAKKDAAETELQMARNAMSNARGFLSVTDEDSEQFFKDMLEHEDVIRTEYENAIRGLLEQMQMLTESYQRRVAEAENVINKWHYLIHPNYYNPHMTFSETGTHYAKHPVPVHAQPYTGGELANRIKGYCQREATLNE